MTPFIRSFRHDLLRISRAALVLVVTAVFLVTSVAHGACDLELTAFSGQTAMSAGDADLDHSDKSGAAEHHCHGCFSVSMPNPVIVSATEMIACTIVLHEAVRHGEQHGIDPPPPKFLI